MKSHTGLILLAMLNLCTLAIGQSDAKTEEVFQALASDPDEARSLQLIQTVDKNSMNSEGRTLLMVASMNKKFQVVEALIDAGADLNIVSTSGFPTMFFVSATNRGTVLEKAVRRGGKLDVRAPDKTTLLHRACEEGLLSTIRYLISQKVDVNAKTENGVTPLMFAAYAGKEKVIQELLKAGADTKVTVIYDNNSPQGLVETAYSVAVRRRHGEAAEILRQAMGLPKPQTLTTTLEGDPW